MRSLLLFMTISLLTACTAANEAADNLAQERAKSVVNGVAAKQFPGVNAAPVTDCVIEAASAGEIISLAGASVTGVTEGTVRQVLEIAARPDATQCIAKNSLSLLSDAGELGLPEGTAA